MTEFKRLTAAQHALEGHVEDLQRLLLRRGQCGNDDELAVQLHRVDMVIRDVVHSTLAPMKKILLKARETNPDRQIYNQSMCDKIEVLFALFCATLVILVGDEPVQQTMGADGEALDLDQSELLQLAQKEHDLFLLREAASSAWREKVARTHREAIDNEVQGRQIMLALVRQARTAIGSEFHEELHCIRASEERQRQEKWQNECARRASEVAALGEPLFTKPEDTFRSYLALRIAEGASTLTAPQKRHLALHIHQLAASLRTAPENPGTRRLRCNNANVVSSFGHRSLTADTPGGPCCCRAMSACAEVLWVALGYEVMYTPGAVCSPPALIEQEAFPAVLPCGCPAPSHVFSPLGHEEYSDRLFVLREPDPSTTPDEWFTWYARLSDVDESLRGWA